MCSEAMKEREATMDREEAMHRIVLSAEEGRTFIEMGQKGPKLTVVSGNSMWLLDEPNDSVPLIEKLIPQLETAGHLARKCAEEGKKILARWERLQSDKKQEPTKAEREWLARHIKIDRGPPFSVSVNSKDPEIVRRAAEIAEKMIGKPQAVGHGQGQPTAPTIARQLAKRATAMSSKEIVEEMKKTYLNFLDNVPFKSKANNDRDHRAIGEMLDTLRPKLNPEDQDDFKAFLEHQHDECLVEEIEEKPVAGKVAGKLGDDGYWWLEFEGQKYRRCDLLWKMHTGRDPRGIIEHINGNRTDDRFENLREVSPSQT